MLQGVQAASTSSPSAVKPLVLNTSDCGTTFASGTTSACGTTSVCGLALSCGDWPCLDPFCECESPSQIALTAASHFTTRLPKLKGLGTQATETHLSLQEMTLNLELWTEARLLQGTALPKALTLGPAEVQGSMEGPHTNPTIQATWKVPVAEASGQVKLDKNAMHLSAKYVADLPTLCMLVHLHSNVSIMHLATETLCGPQESEGVFLLQR